MSQNYQFQTILNPGTVRFSPFANITTNPTWQGNTVTMDWSFTVTAVPEPSTFGLAAIGVAGAGIAFRRRRLARRSS